MTEAVDDTIAPPTAEISVVIPTYNRAATLDRCLQHLSRQTVPLDRFEVIVADDASTDDTEATALRWSERGLRVRYVRCPKVFAGGARNRGVEVALAPRVLFLGDDILATSDLVERHLRAADASHDGTVFVGEVRYEHDGELPPFMRFLEDEGVHHDFPALRAAGDAPIGGRYFYACNASVPTDRFRASGGFDERLQRAWEDSELGIRLEEAGVPFRFLPGPTGTHVHPTSLPRYLAFLRNGRADMVSALRQYLATHDDADQPVRRPVVDSLTPDWVMTVLASAIDGTERWLPDRVRRRAYRGVLRRERRRVTALAAQPRRC